MRKPPTKLEWCRTCGERYEMRAAKTPARSLITSKNVTRWYYYAEPHECPATCPWCGVEHTVTRRQVTITKNTHTCPGKEEAARKEAETTRQYMAAMNTVFRKALSGR